MNFWISPYSSSAQQQYFEERINKEEQVEAESLADSIIKSFTARIVGSNWLLETHKADNTIEKNICSNYEAELFGTGEEFLKKVNYCLSFSKMHSDEKLLIKKVTETVADERYLNALQLYFSHIQIYSTNGDFICQLIANRKKNRFLSITVKQIKTTSLIESDKMVIETKNRPSKIWRLFKPK